ncbi:hypothetical protein JAAARDRAFT_191206 [Jaapia argillacea MUCL 33604]|uniref:Uncharacterized protein n=1 Tax=Jaapia argillacea MUCL 33604 TaxID=933084 RepID=A0A067Q297_9AGAM|nr:hypothetical protein JAAARDRAFT_191206 [Jaapia argillacea MUCL 33604]
MPAARTPKTTPRSKPAPGHATRLQQSSNGRAPPLMPKPKATFTMSKVMGLESKPYRAMTTRIREIGEKYLDTSKTWADQTHHAREVFLREARKSNPIFEEYVDAWPVQYYTANLWLAKKLSREKLSSQDRADGNSTDPGEDPDEDGNEGFSEGQERGHKVEQKPEYRKSSSALNPPSNRNGGTCTASGSQSTMSSSSGVVPASQAAPPLRQVCGSKQDAPSPSLKSSSTQSPQASSNSRQRRCPHLPKFFTEDEDVYNACRKYGLASPAGWELFLHSDISEREDILDHFFITRQVSPIQYRRMVKEVLALCDQQ